MSQPDRTLLTSSYDYELPKELIADYPANPRSSAKLLVVDRANGTIIHSNISDICDFIPKDTAIVVNNTKVIKARIFGRKKSGGKIECVVIKPFEDGAFLALIRGKVKTGDRLFFEDDLSLEVLELLDDGSRKVSFLVGETKIGFAKLIEKLDKIGHIPLPPYINREDEKSDETNYQSRFASNAGSVAAPTASLHFDEELLDKIKQSHKLYELTLHVGLGTFKPVEAENIEEHPMHSEYFEIPVQTAKLLDSDAKILCIGTTSTRTVEHYHRTKKTSGECDIFINPQNPPKRANMLLTNFHLPKSTLIMLVAGFVGLDRTLEIYKEAIEKKYRFYSYGDAMLIL